jgi:protein-S-isoprenylcysteine O-methyltransferase Ste14
MRESSTSAEDRGDRWVMAQFALMVLVLAAGWLPPGWPAAADRVLPAVGAVCSLLGALVAVWAWRTLDRAATPYPRPREGGRLIDTGPYEYVRHPIYSAGVLFFAGYALATSPAALVPLVALAVLWRNKAALEEELLARRYPEYRDYRARVTGAFIPRPSSASPSGD